MISQLEDVFMYADIEKVEMTEIDTVRATVSVRGTGHSITVEDDDIDLVANEIARQVDRQVWLVNDIINDYGLTLDQLRELVLDEVDRAQSYAPTYGYSDGYTAGYDDAMRNSKVYDEDMGELLDEVESHAYDEGYIAGLNDGLNSEYMSTSDHDYQSITLDYEDYPEAWEFDSLDAPVEPALAAGDNIIPMQSAVALAAQPFLARDPETDDLYIAYRIDR